MALPVFPTDPYLLYSPVQSRMVPVQFRVAQKKSGLLVSVVEYLFGNGVRVIHAQVCKDVAGGFLSSFSWPATGVLASLSLDAPLPPDWFDSTYARYLRTQKLSDAPALCSPDLLPSEGLDDLLWNELQRVHGMSLDFPTAERRSYWVAACLAVQPIVEAAVEAADLRESASALSFCIQSGAGARDPQGDPYLPVGHPRTHWSQLGAWLTLLGQEYQDGGREALRALCAAGEGDSLVQRLPPEHVAALQRCLDAWLPTYRGGRIARDFDAGIQLPLRVSVTQFFGVNVTPLLTAVNVWLNSPEGLSVQSFGAGRA